ncbi:MAG: GNAT family N-acetyltransferase [Hahellaceae bacterium]|nr:GNAT family N-acetyltransferase [Hahellaceae bacterium]MCP5169160.1 GNAT family N-acetyltransferase [Hahellaceae bacterium]
MTLAIEIATTPDQYTAGHALFSDYARYLGLDLEFQGFSEELTRLPQMYGHPRGCLLLARKGEVYIGAVGLRQFAPGIAEMKRLFVQTEHQGVGAGRQLLEAFIAQAKTLGYASIRLDTIPELDKALKLYEAYGFIRIPPYRHNPYPNAVFMERNIE